MAVVVGIVDWYTYAHVKYDVIGRVNYILGIKKDLDSVAKNPGIEYFIKDQVKHQDFSHINEQLDHLLTTLPKDLLNTLHVVHFQIKDGDVKMQDHSPEGHFYGERYLSFLKAFA